VSFRARLESDIRDILALYRANDFPAAIQRTQQTLDRLDEIRNLLLQGGGNIRAIQDAEQEFADYLSGGVGAIRRDLGPLSPDTQLKFLSHILTRTQKKKPLLPVYQAAIEVLATRAESWGERLRIGLIFLDFGETAAATQKFLDCIDSLQVWPVQDELRSLRLSDAQKNSVATCLFSAGHSETALKRLKHAFNIDVALATAIRRLSDADLAKYVHAEVIAYEMDSSLSASGVWPPHSGPAEQIGNAVRKHFVEPLQAARKQDLVQKVAKDALLPLAEWSANAGSFETALKLAGLSTDEKNAARAHFYLRYNEVKQALKFALETNDYGFISTLYAKMGDFQNAARYTQMAKGRTLQPG